MTQDTKRTMADFDFEKVHAAHQRLVNSHFRQEPQARMQIPANPDDDDLYVSDFIDAAERQSAELAAVRERERRMRVFLERFVAYADNPWVHGPVTVEQARALLAEGEA